MRRNYWLYIMVFLVACQTTKEWSVADIKPVKSYGKNCSNYVDISRKIPKEGGISLYQRDNNLYLHLNDKNLYKSLFAKNYDGIAIDVIREEAYNCQEPGEAWKVFFKENLDSLKNLSVNPNKMVLSLGELPEKFAPAKTECNLVILQRKYICDYDKYLNLDPQYWALLDMGIFKDSIARQSSGEVFSLNEKTFEFTIPYEKNEAVIRERDLQPIYDSLDFTDYDIASINIVAFASIEGGQALNENLLDRRSKSVVTALQAYQKPEIIYQIDALENWDQFYTEIRRTRYRDVADMSRDDIKQMLAGNSDMLNKLEPLLARHRKAIVKIFLTRKRKIESLSNQELVSVFNEAVKNENTNRVILLLDYIFERSQNSSNPDELVGELQIPDKSGNSPLFNNLAGYRFTEEIKNYDESVGAFGELHKIFPGNEKILYNLISVKLQQMRFHVNKTGLSDLRGLMNELQVTKLEPSLKYRPWINYYILSNEYYTQINDYRSSRRAIRNILSIYKNIVNYDDQLSIARYLASYNQLDDAEKVMRSVIENTDIPDDLLFFYLNITIPFKKYYEKAYYAPLIERAKIADKKRFCDFFKSSNIGGISFQLLQHQPLKDFYCKICTQ